YAWLNERIEHSLHLFQLSAVSLIVKVCFICAQRIICFSFDTSFFLLQKMYSDFELQAILEDKLNTRTYQTIIDRIKMEEAAASVSNGLHRESDDFEYALLGFASHLI